MTKWGKIGWLGNWGRRGPQWRRSTPWNEKVYPSTLYFRMQSLESHAPAGIAPPA
jgi:hypothetical protein